MDGEVEQLVLPEPCLAHRSPFAGHLGRDKKAYPVHRCGKDRQDV